MICDSKDTKTWIRKRKPIDVEIKKKRKTQKNTHNKIHDLFSTNKWNSCMDNIKRTIRAPRCLCFDCLIWIWSTRSTEFGTEFHFHFHCEQYTPRHTLSLTHTQIQTHSQTLQYSNERTSKSKSPQNDWSNEN